VFYFIPIALLWITIGNYCSWISLYRDLHLSTFFETHFLAIFILERIFNAYLSIERVGPIDTDLSLFCIRLLNDFLNRRWVGSHSAFRYSNSQPFFPLECERVAQLMNSVGK
jgi:hypothetical protein